MNNLFSNGVVSSIGIGTWQMGLKGWGKDYDENSVIEAFKYAVNNGINFVDTAEIYGAGNSEILIGQSLETLERKNIIIATKVAGYNATPSRVFKSIKGSLRRLRIDYVDLYQIHWEPSIYTNLEELFHSMEKLAEEGLINHIGVSNFSYEMLKRASGYLRDHNIESNQIKFNIVERPDDDLISYMNSNDIKLIAWSPLGQGFLSGKYSFRQKPKGGIRKVNYLFSDKNLKRFDPLLKTLKEISSKKGVSVTQIVLAYEAELNVLPIPGFKNMKQAEEISGALKIHLTSEEKNSIEKSLEVTGIINVKETMFPRIIPNTIVRVMSLFL